MLTDLEKLQRRSARLTAELDKATAKRDRKLTEMVRAGVMAATLIKQIRGLQRRCDLAVERLRKHTTAFRRARPARAAAEEPSRAPSSEDPPAAGASHPH